MTPSQEFHSIVNYVLQDALLRQVEKFRPSLPPSYTSHQLREIERISGVSVRILVGKLFDSSEERLWRRYAPRIVPGDEQFSEAERQIIEGVRSRLIALAGENEAAQMEIAERFRRPIYLWQAIHARGASTITPVRFFSIIRRAADKKLISAETCDFFLYVAALIYSVQLALLEWHRVPGHSIRDLCLVEMDDEFLTEIQAQSGFEVSTLPRNVETVLGKYFIDLNSTLNRMKDDGVRLGFRETTLYLPRDVVDSLSGGPSKHAPIWYGDEDIALFISLTEAINSNIASALE